MVFASKDRIWAAHVLARRFSEQNTSFSEQILHEYKKIYYINIIYKYPLKRDHVCILICEQVDRICSER